MPFLGDPLRGPFKGYCRFYNKVPLRILFENRVTFKGLLLKDFPMNTVRAQSGVLVYGLELGGFGSVHPSPARIR